MDTFLMDLGKLEYEQPQSTLGGSHTAFNIPEGYALVPLEPMPEVIGAWYRHKNGHHFHDEPPPTDTSCYGAYRAMIAAASEVANRQLRLAFASTNPEARWTADSDKACTACGGSGHIDDMKKAAQ